MYYLFIFVICFAVMIGLQKLYVKEISTSPTDNWINLILCAGTASFIAIVLWPQ